MHFKSYIMIKDAVIIRILYFSGFETPLIVKPKQFTLLFTLQNHAWQLNSDIILTLKMLLTIAIFFNNIRDAN